MDGRDNNNLGDGDLSKEQKNQGVGVVNSIRSFLSDVKISIRRDGETDITNANKQDVLLRQQNDRGR